MNLFVPANEMRANKRRPLGSHKRFDGPTPFSFEHGHISNGHPHSLDITRLPASGSRSNSIIGHVWEKEERPFI